MIPRGLRLKRDSFGALARAKRRESPHFTLSVSPAALHAGGCAVVVSKKVAASSVGRHLIKRRVMAVLTPWCTQDVARVVFAKRGSASLPFKALEAELSSLLAS